MGYGLKNNKPKILREASMDNYFKNNTYNPMLDNIDQYRKVPDRPEIARIPILNLGQQTQSDPVGIIRVDTQPTGANFYLLNPQGQEINFGSTTDSGLTITDVDVGTYNYTVKKEGYKDYKDQITVLENQVCCADINLESAQKSEMCQPIVQPQPAPVPSQGASGFFISDRDILKGVGLLLAGIAIGYFLSRLHKD